MTDNDARAKVAEKRHLRTCAGCGKHAAAEELVRVVHDPSSGEVAVDLAGSGFGRGAHFHATPDCVAKAFKGGLARVFKSKVVGDVSAVGAEIVQAADRRIEGLLSGARRAGQVAVGSDAVVEAWRREQAELVVVARDAAAATKLPEVEKAIASGKAIANSEKQRLGLLMGRGAQNGEVAVVAVLHPGVAAAVARAYRMSGPFRASGALGHTPPGPGRGTDNPAVVAQVESTDRSEEAWSSLPEVR